MSCCDNRPRKIIIQCGGDSGDTVDFTASNVNLTGVGVLEAQTDSTLTFRGVASSGGTITVSSDDANNTVNVEANTTAILAAIPDATTSVKGKTLLATDVIAMTKTDGTRALTPLNLAALGASTTFIGLTRLATVVETQAGTLATVAVTPAGLDATLATFPTQQTFANNAARLAAVPAFIGQIGTQQDTLTPYVASNTIAGSFDSPLIAAGIVNTIATDMELAANGGDVTISSISNQGLVFFNGGVLNMLPTGRMHINGAAVPADSIVTTTGTAGQLDSVAKTQFLGAFSPAATYTITNQTESRTFDADTVTVAQLADIVATLISDLDALNKPTF